MRDIIILPSDFADPIEIVKTCGGWYDRPKGSGVPLVGYAARYDGVHQWVGETYCDFSAVEVRPSTLQYAARRLQGACLEKQILGLVTVICGMPMGGLRLGGALSDLTDFPFIFPEKEVLQTKTETSREKSRLVFGRHRPLQNDLVAIVEDVFNNASTVNEAVELVRAQGAQVACIACFLNRSLKYDTMFTPKEGEPIPIVSVVRKPIPEYKQDDPYVLADVLANNVVWKPKNERKRLQQAMAGASR